MRLPFAPKVNRRGWYGYRQIQMLSVTITFKSLPEKLFGFDRKT